MIFLFHSLSLEMSWLSGQVLRINLYLQPTPFFLSIVSNLLNIRVLSSRNLRASPCTYYLIAYAIFNILYTCIVCPSQFLRSWRIQWSSSPVTCRLSFFLAFLFPVERKIMLLLASLDRHCSCSKSRQLNSTSTTRTAKISIAVYMSAMTLVYHWNETKRRV